MYRKKLMRACLTGLMVVTVATANVAPVFAAEAPAEETVQEPGAGAVGADVTVKFVDERGNVIDEKNLSFDEGIYNYEMLDQYLPAGYERKSMGDFHALQGTVIEVRVMQKAPVEEVQNVKINYYDEAAKKQVAEVPVQVSIDTSCVNMAILTRYLPEGYTIEGTDCIIRDGYVYVSVAPAEEVQNVKINYYDEDAEKQVAEVPVQVSIDTSCVNMAILTR